jgi:hypothetical protein
MKTKIEELSEKTRNLIAKYATKGNSAASIAQLASTLTRLQQLENQFSQIETELPRIEESLNQYADVTISREHSKELTVSQHTLPSPFDRKNGHKKDSKIIRIEIDWASNGKSKGKETICESVASKTMAKWASRLYEEMGIEILHRLSTFKVNRGFLVSKNPERDYLKPDGRPYACLPILNTGYFILTNSQTWEKIEDITNACRFLGLPIGMVTVYEVEKNYLIKSLLA